MQTYIPVSFVSPRSLIIMDSYEWLDTKYEFGGDSKTGIDCSHFVYEVFRKRIPTYPYLTTTEYPTSARFRQVPEPAPADLVYWAPPAGDSSGHIAIVIDPDEGTFIGAQGSTGVAVANYTTAFWGGHLRRQYFRFKELVL
ncbi:MAG: NlpC/P60 family protein [Candidatus Sulfotelmatobacter sp.]|jgi:cell wall-associated NlpC family hydrolase